MRPVCIYKSSAHSSRASVYTLLLPLISRGGRALAVAATAALAAAGLGLSSQNTHVSPARAYARLSAPRCVCVFFLFVSTRALACSINLIKPYIRSQRVHHINQPSSAAANAAAADSGEMFSMHMCVCVNIITNATKKNCICSRK